MGQLACKLVNLPITYANWRNILTVCKDEIFDKEIKVLPNWYAIFLIYLRSSSLYTLTKVVFFNSLQMRFHFDVAKLIARSWTIKNLGRNGKTLKGDCGMSLVILP